MKCYRALSLVLALALTCTTAPTFAKSHKLTLAQIEAAKKKTADAAELASHNEEPRK
jgi:hypothetical protein